MKPIIIAIVIHFNLYMPYNEQNINVIANPEAKTNVVRMKKSVPTNIIFKLKKFERKYVRGVIKRPNTQTKASIKRNR